MAYVETRYKITVPVPETPMQMKLPEAILGELDPESILYRINKYPQGGSKILTGVLFGYE